MWFSLVILIIIQPSESVIQLEQHFRPLGKVATGLTYAHLGAQINVSSLEHAFTSLVQTIILREKASNATVEQALLAIIAPQLLIGKKAIKDINVQFFMKETSERDKRQILGFISMGMSIFNLGKIQQLDNELGALKINPQMVSDTLPMFFKKTQDPYFLGFLMYILFMLVHRHDLSN